MKPLTRTVNQAVSLPQDLLQQLVQLPSEAVEHGVADHVGGQLFQ